MKITDKETIMSIYGENFAQLIGNKRIEFTEDYINITLYGNDKYFSAITDNTSNVVPMREPRTRDIKLSDRFKGDVAKSTAILSAVTGISEDDIDEMTARNVTLLSEVMSYFLGKSQATSGE